MRDRFPFQKFFKFLVIGGLGFVVDAVAFQVHCKLDLSIAISRLVAFSVALISTFLLNRIYTYKQTNLPILRQFAKYVLASSTGGAINLATFFIMLHWLPIARSLPLLALLLASITGLVANFSLYTIYVFSPRATKQVSSLTE